MMPVGIKPYRQVTSMCLEFERDYLMVAASFILFLALLLLLLLLGVGFINKKTKKKLKNS